MTSIRTFSEILVSNPDLEAEQARHFAGIIQHESERLTRLLGQILELNRLESGEMDWSPQQTDAVAIMRDAIETMHGLAHEFGPPTIHDELGAEPIVIFTDAGPDENRSVSTCYPMRSSSTIQRNPGIWIRRVGPTDAGDFELQVVDNGPGIAPEHQASLFSKLSRGWNRPAQRPEGSGVGLAISRQIMEHVGGDLVLARSDTTGSCFAMRFPVHLHGSGFAKAMVK